MQYDQHEKAFILDGNDLIAIGMPTELGLWPIEDAGHLFEEITFAPQRIAELQEWYPHASPEWIAQERVRRFDVLAKMRDVLVEHGFSTTEPNDASQPPDEN